MQKVKIFTDSAADLPAEIVARYDIGVVPIVVSFADRTYADGKDLTAAEFYALLADAPRLPVTSQPSPQDFVDAFKPDLQAGRSIVTINLSSGLSGTVESVNLAKEALGELAQNRLYAVDSLAASGGQGLLVLLAADMAAQGKSAPEIAAGVREARQHLVHLFTLEKMDNLVKGGRISRTKGAVGDLLNIKPILYIDEQGFIDLKDKVRGRKKSLRHLLQQSSQAATGDKYLYRGVSHANCLPEAQEVAAQLQQVVPEATMIIGDIGAAVGTHTGQGCIAIFYFQ